MIIIGIDPGTQITGYGIIKLQQNVMIALDYGCIRPPKRDKLSNRYLILFNALEQLLDKYRPEALAVETQFVRKNAQSALKLGMARGVAILAAKRTGIPVYEYAPSKAKLAVAGNGAASKQQIQGMMKLLLNLSQIPEPEDAADALALAVCHAHSLNTAVSYGNEM